MSRNPRSSGSLSEMFDVLSHRYRRRLLVALADGDPRPRDDLVTEISRQNDPETLNLELHHVHLPKLDAIGFINWDRQTGRITHGPQFEKIAPVLTLLSEHRDEFPNDWP